MPHSVVLPGNRVDARLQGLRVLTAEDEPLLSIALEDMLGELGCHVVASAATLAQALEFGSGTAFDIAVLDVSLGSEKIYPAADAIAARGIPVVLATGHSFSDVSVRMGVNGVIEKPFTSMALEKALLDALAH